MHLLRLLLPLLTLAAFDAAAADCPRIVSQSPYLTIALDWLGRGDCVVGVSRYDERQLPHTGGVSDPDAAAIAALAPDLIVTSMLTAPDTLAAVTPAGARSLRLGGYRSLAESEQMVAALAAASGSEEAAARARRFSRELQQRLAAMPARQRRILLVSACATRPYSYGRNTMLGDLAEKAGFTLAESAEGIHHLHDGEPIDSIPALVAATRPDIVVNLMTRAENHCDARLGALPVTLLMLPGDNFFHPGPRLLEGLDELKEALQ
ncbi:hypothetical protein [Azospira restricta]|uniref:ABC transporter substrate-binding protein n=1 Tax=Azospira restricta TaxID=404405 RepID=A0A974SPT4_9RHOO|nr:hypothetical protein [Azospira restricta]QRJ64184.1 ABC transporter substrate-binding protein [Azospira restricta]